MYNLHVCKSVDVMRENTEAEKGRGGKKKERTEGGGGGGGGVVVSERDRERGQHSTDTHSGEKTDRNRMSKDGKIMTTSRLCPPPPPPPRPLLFLTLYVCVFCLCF